MGNELACIQTHVDVNKLMFPCSFSGGTILAYFPYLEVKIGIRDLPAVWVFLSSAPECLNEYKIWSYIYIYILPHPSGVLHKSFPISLSVDMCIPLSLLGNGSMKMLPRKRKQNNIRILIM
jgi:hypothetical protein